VIEQIEQAVTATLQLLNTPELQPQMQFHPGTNLLIVVGSEEAIDVARKVVAALEKR
jgi:hypothetical protein